jgi:hemolysin activation/secretion protein
MGRLLVLVGSWALMACLGEAQDFPRVAPKELAPPLAAPVPPAPAPRAKEDATPLLDRLSGLVFVAKPSEVVTTGMRVKGVVIKDVPVPDPRAFDQLTAKYIGTKLTHGDLNRLVRDVIFYYRGHDRPVVDVFVPEQDIASGTVQLVVLEGRIGQVRVTGNRWLPASQISDSISLPAGGVIRSSELQDDLDWLNENPFHTTDLVYHPGQTLGATDLELQTKDRFPARFYLGYDDTGNAETGFDRYEAGVNWGDAFGLGQQLNYQYSTSGNGDSLRAHAGSYVIPLPWHNTVTFFGSYVDTKGLLPPLIGITGRSYQISGRYGVPLPTIRDGADRITYKETISAGFDYKYNKDSLEFGGLPAGGTLYDIDQFVVSYNGAETDPFGQTTLDNELYLSPGSWGGNNNDSAFNQTHTGATSDYAYDTLTLERLTRLPGDWSLILRGTLQQSSANLPPSEQLEFGGYNSVRGYDQDEVNADEGYIFSTEVRTPTLSVGNLFHRPWLQDQLQLVAFWDYGSASNHDLLPGERNETSLSSVGAGVRYTLNTYLSVRFDYGYQLHSTGLDTDHGSRSDLGIVLSY